MTGNSLTNGELIYLHFPYLSDKNLITELTVHLIQNELICSDVQITQI